MMTSAGLSPDFAAQKYSLSLSNVQLIILVLGFLEFLLFHFLASDNKRLLQIFHTSIFHSHHHTLDTKSDSRDDEVTIEKRGEASVSRSDADVVLRSLGMSSSSSGGGGEASFDLWEVLEEQNPSLEEVKEAFDVFDGNRDGFIDAHDLQKVLCSLGFEEGLKLENCRAMIAEFDQNGDDRIDFQDFLALMEISFC